MSKSSCPWCNHSNITTDGRDHCCNYCGYEWQSKPTVFDRITVSPEVLALEFVNEAYDMSRHEFRYFSCLTKEFYDDEKEAIAATVARLREVKK